MWRADTLERFRAVAAEVDRLLDGHTEAEMAELLNQKGLTSGTDKRFHRLIVRRMRLDCGLKSRYRRLRVFAPQATQFRPDVGKRAHASSSGQAQSG